MRSEEELKERAKLLRKEIIQLVHQRKSGHTGGAYSIVEVLVSLFYEVMKNEDKFILSKGHGCLPYFILLREKGYNPTIMGHPEIDPKNGIPCTTGSLGHGFPTSIGMALARRLKNDPGHIYVMVSDAECQEGTTWESAMIASQHKLSNLTLIIDNNGKQTLGHTSDILSIEPIGKKFEAFNWNVESIDGHSFPQIIAALNKRHQNDKPTVIISNSVKGKGVKFMEADSGGWHNVVPSDQDLAKILEELG